MIRAATLLAAVLVLANPGARAQSYPTRTITLVIPFAAGGSNDVIGRAVGKKLTDPPHIVRLHGAGDIFVKRRERVEIELSASR